MKFSRFTLLSGKDALSHLLLLTLVSGSICLFSCEDDMDRPSPSSHVSFTTEISSSWTPSTRSTTDTDTPQGTVTALQGGSTPLYLHTLYTDSIALPSADSRPDTSVLTRATPIKSDDMYEKFGVSAYSYTGSWSEDRTSNYFYNVTASKSGGSYTLPSTYYWPGASYKMKFFAHAPKDNGQYVLSSSTQAGSPTIEVTIPSDVNAQEDLLVARTDELPGNTNTAVALTFNHALTAIRFVCGDAMQRGTVKSVSLKNVYSKGTYNMEQQSWSNAGTPATFSQTLNKLTLGNEGNAITTEAQTFMMVPQTLPDGAQIEVVFSDQSNNEHTLTADIKGTIWPMGKTVTYKISTLSINWTYTLKVSEIADFSYTGGTQSYTVTSYRKNGNGKQEAVAWTAQYSENDGQTWSENRPDWLTAFTISGNGGTSAQSYDATVIAQTGTDTSPHTAALRNATAKGTADVPYNLANQSSGGPMNENTANCYVVSAPGYYSFPLVYGNAIKNSATNESAYKTGKSGKHILTNFINHKGNPITSPYIRQNAGCTPAKAELVWQDAPNLVTNIKYNNTGNGNISFKVDKSTIRQGNAVIAIKDAGNNVLWSWHIWVTDEDISRTIEITNYQGHTYRMLPVNIGWCDDYTTTYAQRSCKVMFAAGGERQTITVKQASNSITTGPNNTFYQWGRKDPIYPGDMLRNTNKTWYDKDGTSSTDNPATEDLSTGVTCMMNYILKPDVMHNQPNSDDTYINLWSINNTVYTVNDNPVVKTVYDPSPVGSSIPPGNAFTGFTTTGQTVNTRSEINGTWDGKLGGWHFYTDSSKSKTLFFPVSGSRNYTDGRKYNLGSSGTCYTTNPNGPNNGSGMFFGSSNMEPVYQFYRGVALSVRCVKEQ